MIPFEKFCSIVGRSWRKQSSSSTCVISSSWQEMCDVWLFLSKIIFLWKYNWTRGGKVTNVRELKNKISRTVSSVQSFFFKDDTISPPASAFLALQHKSRNSSQSGQCDTHCITYLFREPERLHKILWLISHFHLLNSWTSRVGFGTCICITNILSGSFDTKIYLSSTKTSVSRWKR